MVTLLKREDNSDIYSVVDELSAKINIHKINIYIYNSDQYTGRAGSKGLSFPKALIEDAKLYPSVFKFFVGHELIHFLHKEYGFMKAFISTVSILTAAIVRIKTPMQKDNAKTLLSEMRANIEGATLACLSNEEVIEVQELAQQKNNDTLIPKSYEVGYPDRKMIADYCSKYKHLNENIAKEILNDFCEKMDISNKQKFIDKVIKIFFKSKNKFY